MAATLTYCTEDEVRAAWGRGFIDAVAANDDGLTTDAVLEKSNGQAVRMIHQWTGGTYVTPYDAYPDTPDAITHATIELTGWFMACRLIVESQEYQMAKTRYEAVLSWLKLVAAGKQPVTGAATLATGGANPFEIVSNDDTNPEEFTDDYDVGGQSLKNWGISKKTGRPWQ